MSAFLDHYRAMAEVNVTHAAASRAFTRQMFASFFDFAYSLIANVAQKGMRVKPTEMVQLGCALN